MNYLLLFFGLSLLFNCSNEFDLIAEGKDIPIVYGVLSSSEEFNYIRVERAFVDQNQSALDLAQDPEFLYYDNIIVNLKNADTQQEINLERINVEELGIERETGVFATSPNILYRFKEENFPLEDDQTINLTITDGDTEQILTESSTKIVGKYAISESAPANPLLFRYDSDFTITWRSDEDQALFYDVFMKIKYEEQNPADPSEWIEKELLWTLDQTIERPVSAGNQLAPSISFIMPGIKFYEFIAQNIDGSVETLRNFRGIDIIVNAGGENLFNYIDVGSANTGITSNQIINNFTNLSEGLGVFSSKSTVQVTDYNLRSISRDSLRNGVITKHLNFQ